jgi:hypothetical protein
MAFFKSLHRVFTRALNPEGEAAGRAPMGYVGQVGAADETVDFPLPALGLELKLPRRPAGPRKEGGEGAGGERAPDFLRYLVLCVEVGVLPRARALGWARARVRRVASHRITCTPSSSPVYTARILMPYAHAHTTHDRHAKSHGAGRSTRPTCGSCCRCGRCCRASTRGRHASRLSLQPPPPPPPSPTPMPPRGAWGTRMARASRATGTLVRGFGSSSRCPPRRAAHCPAPPTFHPHARARPAAPSSASSSNAVSPATSGTGGGWRASGARPSTSSSSSAPRAS